MDRPIVKIELPHAWAMSNQELSLLTAAVAMTGKAILDSRSAALVSLDCIGRILDALAGEAKRRGMTLTEPPFQRVRLEVDESPESEAVLN
jgi:hypothetical protein